MHLVADYEYTERAGLSSRALHDLLVVPRCPHPLPAPFICSLSLSTWEALTFSEENKGIVNRLIRQTEERAQVMGLAVRERCLNRRGLPAGTQPLDFCILDALRWRSSAASTDSYSSQSRAETVATPWRRDRYEGEQVGFRLFRAVAEAQRSLPLYCWLSGIRPHAGAVPGEPGRA